MKQPYIPFNRPYLTGREIDYIKDAVKSGILCGEGAFSEKCGRFIEENYHTGKVFLTGSCSSALDMSALILDIKEGDEVILPSFTFTSTANPFYISGAVLRFVDIRSDTLNINEEKIEEIINERTSAIILNHYAGVPCEMDKIAAIAKKHNLFVVEDAATAAGSRFNEKYLGSIGDIGCFSFHETKNIICGEGGAITINNPLLIEKAEIIRDKGTNRSKFFRGEIDKYSWVDKGSSFILGELTAAFLYAQLEESGEITKKRKAAWDYYYDNLKTLEENGFLKLPKIPDNCDHNAHIFYILLRDRKQRDALIKYLGKNNIKAVFHYVPLHSSPVGLSMGYTNQSLPVTEDLAARLVRLPLFNSITRKQQEQVVERVNKFVSGHN